MIFKIPFLISYISSIMTLMEGDVILTGNVSFSCCYTAVLDFQCVKGSLCQLFHGPSTGTPPDGVGPVRVGQKINAGITDLIDVEFDVERRKRSFSY